MTNSPILQEKLVLIRMSKETEYNLQQLRTKSAKANFTEDIIFHCKTKRKHNTMDPLLHEKIHGFYNKDVVSWVQRPEKKKLQLVNKTVTPAAFHNLSKPNFKGFPYHQYNLDHTY